MDNIFFTIGLSVILALIASKKIPQGAVRGLAKLRDALNLALPPDLGSDAQGFAKAGKGFKIVK